MHIGEGTCFLDKVTVANGSQLGDKEAASNMVQSTLGRAVRWGLKSIVDCEKCGSLFAVYDGGLVRLYSTNACDGPLGNGGQEPGDQVVVIKDMANRIS